MGRQLTVNPKAHCIHVTANIRYQQALMGMSTEEICRKASIGESAFYKKLKKPETFTAGDISRLSKALCCDMVDLVERRKKK